jgi:hypothetical protein
MDANEISLTICPAGGGAGVPVAFLTQSLLALQEMVYLSALQTEGRPLRERLRLPEDLKNRYVLQCSPPEQGSFRLRGRVVGPGGEFPSVSSSAASRDSDVGGG